MYFLAQKVDMQSFFWIDVSNQIHWTQCVPNFHGFFFIIEIRKLEREGNGKKGRWWPTIFYGGASNSTISQKFWGNFDDENSIKSGFSGVLAYASEYKGSKNSKNGLRFLLGQK